MDVLSCVQRLLTPLDELNDLTSQSITALRLHDSLIVVIIIIINTAATAAAVMFHC